MKNIKNLVSTQIIKKVQTSEDCKGSGNELPTFVEQEEYVRVPAHIFERMLNYIESDDFWDIGLLGNSEEHAKTSSMPVTLKDKLRQRVLDRRSEDPWRWATHQLKASPTTLYMLIGEDWYIFVDGKWQPTEIWSTLLTSVTYELHGTEWISRKKLKDLEEEYLKEGSFEPLVDQYIDLANTNSLGVLNTLVTYQVLFNRYNIKW